MEKVKVTQDFLYKYIIEHNINKSTIALLMNMERSTVISCFKHHLDKYGKPRCFPQKTIPRLNDSVAKMAEELRNSTIVFGSPQTYTSRRGTFDPGCLSDIKALSRFFNLTAFTNRVLGWTETKKNTVLSAPSSKIYGHITEDDVARINAEILAVSGMLGGIEVSPALQFENHLQDSVLSSDEKIEKELDLLEEMLLSQTT